MAKQIVAAFDFDGTLSQGNCGFRFVRFLLSPTQQIVFFLAHGFDLIRYHFRIGDEACLKRIARAVFSRFSEGELKAKAQTFAREHMDQYQFPDALALLKRYSGEGARCIIVSRSFGIHFRYWAAKFDPPLEIIATELRVENGRFTGELMGLSCDSREKRRRLLEAVPNRDEVELHAYGDTVGDYAMFEIADRAFLRKGAEFVKWSKETKREGDNPLTPS